jgi:hypothetical protein
MLKEITQLKTPVFKILSPDSGCTERLLQIESNISFDPFINYLKENLIAVSNTKEKFYNYLIEKLETGGYGAETGLLQEQDDLLEMLTTSLFPVVADHHKISFALATPYQFKVFYYSDCFKKLFLDRGEKHLLLPEGMSADQLRAIQATMIYDQVLEKFYGIKLNDSPELIYPVTDAETGLKRYYRIGYDRRFIDIRLKGKLPQIQDCGVCMNTFRILDLEKQLATMPLDLFEANGFAVWTAQDVTITESLDAIKKILLRQDVCDTDTIKDLKDTIHALVGLHEVKVGLAPFLKINEKLVVNEDCRLHSLIGKTWDSNDPQSMAVFNEFVDFLKENSQAVAISNLNEEMVKFAPFLKPVFDEGHQSFIGYPLQNSDGLLGILELASPVRNQLTQQVISRLEPAIPFISLAMLKNRETFHQKIQMLIKEKFTMVQQSVEWKFEEVAVNLLRHSESGSTNVVFEDVYPLYGAIDIRNSSMERASALQKDLREHLILLDHTLTRLQELMPLPLLEGLKFRNHSHLQSIKDTINTEDEMRINEFLHQEVKPVLDHLNRNNKQVQDVLSSYFEKVNNNNSSIYLYRYQFEETLAKINQAVVSYLEEQENIIQQSFPHYFEKYRTDGVEYNIYIGQSIAPAYPFDLLYLKNIRLWQMQSMAEVARITDKLLPLLKVPLQTTQLILVHSQCISISFRKDERKFDVEGSYNIRYEVIKKRIDKARLKNSAERLTQPGKIAIVYSNQKEAQEYQEYIEFCQDKRLLKPGIEMLELEELQGIKGLKAMRVAINLEHP